MNVKLSAASIAVILFLLTVSPSTGAQNIRLTGACQGDETHVYAKVLKRFSDQVLKKYDKPVEFTFHYKGIMGVEKDYIAYMNLGINLDFAVIAMSHMASFSKKAPFMDMPFLFRNVEHWKKAMELNVFEPIADDILQKADIMILGYAGGGVRNIFSKKPVTGMASLKNLKIRVMDAPIQTRIFSAVGAKPRALSFFEIKPSIISGVIDAAENEAAGIFEQKFYNIAPEVSLTRHAVTVRPFCFSGKTFRSLPPDLQKIILEAGKDAADYGREMESAQDGDILEAMIEQGKIHVHEFTEKDKLLQYTDAVKKEYAMELGTEDVLDAVSAIE